MKKKSNQDILDIEKPQLNLKKHFSHKKLPKEIPDLLENITNSDKPSEILKVDALIREIEIYLSINDNLTAKKVYEELNNSYNRLSQESKEIYYKKIKTIFNEIKKHESIFYKLKSLFKKKNK